MLLGFGGLFSFNGIDCQNTDSGVEMFSHSHPVAASLLYKNKLFDAIHANILPMFCVLAK